MSAFGQFLRRGVDGNGDAWVGHWCPGCACAHVFYVGRVKRPSWTFNEHPERPTFSPSMRTFVPADSEEGTPEQTLCHYILTDGVINFLPDSTGHALRGEVPLPPFPADYRLE